MVVLALDTTTRAGSVALVVDDRIVEERSGDAARSHAERLPAELLAVADAHGVRMAEVDLFAVASGPGSFTGLRIGIATIQGLALVTRRRVVGIPAFDALAEIGRRDAPDGALIGTWMDAHRRDVFGALYRVVAADSGDAVAPTVVDAASVDAPAALLTRWRQWLDHGDVRFIGDGAVAYRDAISSAVPGARIAGAPLLAGAVGRLATGRARSGDTIDPADIRPLYVRRPDAEVARDKTLAGGQ
jgi:tRNA threonylcarbamoyladenosine biosynthesis protein TsaB